MRLVIIDDEEVKLASFIFDTLSTDVEEESEHNYLEKGKTPCNIQLR